MVGIGGREFSVGKLAGCRNPLTESTLTVLILRICKCKHMEKARKIRPSENTPRTTHQPSVLRILCDTLARWLEAMSSTLVEMVTLMRKLPGRQQVLTCCGEDVVDIEHWRLGGQHTQINRRVCRSSDDGCFPEMTRRATMP